MVPNHYYLLEYCWNIVIWTFRNKQHWNINKNCNILIDENTFENGICEMLPISSQP